MHCTIFIITVLYAGIYFGVSHLAEKHFTTVVCFQNILFSIGSAFLYYVNHFKLYSSFCASHSKAQKVLHPSKYSGICDTTTTPLSLPLGIKNVI